MALDILIRHHFLSGALVIGAISAETGLLVLSRFILSAGVYKFPYPVATTLIQSLITSLLIILAASLSHLLLRHSTPKGPAASLDSTQEAWLLEEEDAGSDYSEEGRTLSPQQIDSRTSAVNNRFEDVVSVSIIYLLRIGLSNLAIIRLSLSNYTLLRLGAVPLLFAFNGGSEGAAHSTVAGSSAILAILSLVLTILPFTEASTNMTNAFVQVGMIISMSVLDALLPLCLLKACHIPSQKASGEGLSAADEKDGLEKLPLTTRVREASRKFWCTIRQASLLSTAIIIPVFLLCGEAQDIRRNSYVLDISCLWHELIPSGMLTGVLLILLSMLARSTSPVGTTFVSIPSSAVQFFIFALGGLSMLGYAGLGLCLVSSGVFFGTQVKDGATAVVTAKRSTYTLVRNFTIAAVACGCIYAITRGQQGTVPSQGLEPSCDDGADLQDTATESNPPLSVSSANDGYLGKRPSVNTIANIDMIRNQCSEIANGTGVDDVLNCLSFLANGESEYLTVLKANTYEVNERASGITKLLNSLGGYESSETTTEPAIKNSALPDAIGICPGPVIPFHVYWTGPATWRFELFVKAYLYTQNLPCSRLWLWLDSDLHPDAIDKMLCSDPIFQRFRPLVQRGDIVLKPWNFPHRIPIPASTMENATGMYFEPRPTSIENETALADNLVRDTNGQHWLTLEPAHAAFSPVQVSDAVRFIVLHLYGGLYCDMDVLLLRDMRPLLLPDPVAGPRAFAEQWVERCGPGDYNTAVISLPAYSSLSTYLLRGGIRMGMNFHPKVIGRMAWLDDRNSELAMLHNAVFDPLVTNLRREGSDSCTVPCHKNFESSFMRVVDEPWDEWKSYRGEQVEDLEGSFPPTNRSLSTWFRGSWAYHIHNQWWKFPEPTSWMDVITRAQDGFFHGSRTNAYGEWWDGPRLSGYNRDTWF